MKPKLTDLAAFSAAPSLSTPLHVGQLNLPAFDALEAELRSVFARPQLSTAGFAARELEQRLAATLGVDHVVCVTNGTVALMLLAPALGLSGEVIVPSFTFAATAQAMSWAGLTPVLCDVDRATHMLSAEAVRPLVTSRTSGILGVHAWGHGCDIEGLLTLGTETGATIFFDACHAMGCAFEGRPIAAYGVASVFSLHATKIVNSAEGGCIATNDGALAALLREMRDGNPANRLAPGLRLKARLSEIQAALCLLSLQDLPRNIEENRLRYLAYKAGLDGVPGIALVEHDDSNNFQYIVAEVEERACGLSRDKLIELLEAENIICRRYFFPGLHHLPPYEFEPRTNQRSFPNTEYLCARMIQFPSGQAVSTEHVAKICDTIRKIVVLSDEIREASRVI